MEAPPPWSGRCAVRDAVDGVQHLRQDEGRVDRLVRNAVAARAAQPISNESSLALAGRRQS